MITETRSGLESLQLHEDCKMLSTKKHLGKRGRCSSTQRIFWHSQTLALLKYEVLKLNHDHQNGKTPLLTTLISSVVTKMLLTRCYCSHIHL